MHLYSFRLIFLSCSFYFANQVFSYPCYLFTYNCHCCFSCLSSPWNHILNIEASQICGDLVKTLNHHCSGTLLLSNGTSLICSLYLLINFSTEIREKSHNYIFWESFKIVSPTPSECSTYFSRLLFYSRTHLSESHNTHLIPT